MRYLLDANILIALTHPEHISHSRATAWYRASGGLFATCPVTQGALIRFILRTAAGASIQQAKSLLLGVVSLKGHQFWPDSIPYLQVPEVGIFGHRQVTDAYLTALARHNGGCLATLDRALAALHAPHAVVIA